MPRQPHPEVELDVEARVPDLELEVRPAQPLPGNLRRWYERELATGTAEGTVEVRGTGSYVTATGWPFVVIRSDHVVEGAIVARRVHAFYVVDQHGVVVVAHGPVDACRQPLLAALVAATPRLRPAVVALAQVWADVLEVR